MILGKKIKTHINFRKNRKKTFKYGSRETFWSQKMECSCFVAMGYWSWELCYLQKVKKFLFSVKTIGNNYLLLIFCLEATLWNPALSAMLIKTQTVLMNVMLLGELAIMLSIFIAFQDGSKRVIPVLLMHGNGITRDMVDEL